jgi:hypothetical protein
MPKRYIYQTIKDIYININADEKNMDAYNLIYHVCKLHNKLFIQKKLNLAQGKYNN